MSNTYEEANCPEPGRPEDVDWEVVSQYFDLELFRYFLRLSKTTEVDAYVRYRDKSEESIHLALIPLSEFITETGQTQLSGLLGLGASHLVVFETNRYYALPVSIEEVMFLSRINELGTISVTESNFEWINQFSHDIQRRFAELYDLDLVFTHESKEVSISILDNHTRLNEAIQELEERGGETITVAIAKQMRAESSRSGLVTRFSLQREEFTKTQITNATIVLRKMGVEIFTIAKVAYSFQDLGESRFLIALEAIARQLFIAYQDGGAGFDLSEIRSETKVDGYRLYKLSTPDQFAHRMGGVTFTSYLIINQSGEYGFLLCTPHEGKVLEMLWQNSGYFDASVWQTYFEDEGAWPPCELLIKLNTKLECAGVFTSGEQPIQSFSELIELAGGNRRLDYLSSNIGDPDQVFESEAIRVKIWDLESDKIDFPVQANKDQAGEAMWLYSIESEEGGILIEAVIFEPEIISWLLQLPGMNYQLLCKMLHYTGIIREDYIQMLRILFDQIRTIGVVTFHVLRQAGYTRFQIESFVSRLSQSGIYLDNIVGVGWTLAEFISGESLNKVRADWLKIVAEQVNETVDETESGNVIGSVGGNELKFHDLSDRDIPLLSGGEMVFATIQRNGNTCPLLLTQNEARMIRIVAENQGYIDLRVWGTDGGAEYATKLKDTRSGLNQKLGLADTGIYIESCGVGFAANNDGRTKYLTEATRQYRVPWKINGQSIEVVEMGKLLSSHPGICYPNKRGNSPTCDFVVFNEGDTEFGFEFQQSIMEVLRRFRDSGGVEICPNSIYSHNDSHRRSFMRAYVELWRILSGKRITNKPLESLKIRAGMATYYKWFW